MHRSKSPFPMDNNYMLNMKVNMIFVSCIFLIYNVSYNYIIYDYNICNIYHNFLNMGKAKIQKIFLDLHFSVTSL